MSGKVFNPWNPKNRELTPTDAIPILKKYGWKGRFTDFKLFQQACVHKSYVNRPELWEENGEGTVLADRPDRGARRANRAGGSVQRRGPPHAQ
jgi:hypothetical protein